MPALWTCTNDYDYSCKHCDESKRNFGASIKTFIGANPCWGHTGYMVFQLGDGNYKFKTLEIYYRTSEICSYSDSGSECSPADCYAGTTSGGKHLPPSWPAEGGMWCSPHGCPPQGTDGTDTPWYLYVEASTDGKIWDLIGKIPFDWVKRTTTATLNLNNWVTARFIRIRQPDDEGQKTFAGYLDSVHINIPDLTKISDDTPPYVEVHNDTLNASNSLDAAVPYGGGEKKFWGAKTTTVSRTADEMICGDMGVNKYIKYFWASGNHAATWFVGSGKKWVISSVTGNISLASFRGAKSASVAFQWSMDGANWVSSQPQSVGADGSYDIEISFEQPVEARFVRLIIIPTPWSSGSIPPAWITDANLTIGQPTGKTLAAIEDITWFPDYPDKQLPPNEEITVATLDMRNAGAKTGNVYFKVYVVSSGQWTLATSDNYYLNPNQSVSLTIKGTTPASGILHVAIVAYGEDETEPALPDPSTCP